MSFNIQVHKCVGTGCQKTDEELDGALKSLIFTLMIVGDRVEMH